MVSDETELKPLNISCTSTDCSNDRHCFLQKHRKKSGQSAGPCRSCGADLVEWPRVQARNIQDIDYTFESLKKELIRHEFWHRPFDEKAVNHARRKGRLRMRDAAERRLRSSVGRAENFREGRQTPFSGSTIYYAQHAVACCCRRCIEYWHGIDPGRALADEEVAYLTELVVRYLEERMPWLPNEPEKVPPRRRSHVKRKQTKD